MALLKAARVADVPTLDVVAPGLVVEAGSASASAAVAMVKTGAAAAGGGGRFSVIGHRGKGMNALASADPRMQEVRENTVRSFNDAARFPVDYVEFDVQVLIHSFIAQPPTKLTSVTSPTYCSVVFGFLSYATRRRKHREKKEREESAQLPSRYTALIRLAITEASGGLGVGCVGLV
jgi:hypothetical protein